MTTTQTTKTVKKIKVPVKTFRDLGTWQVARDLAVAAHRLTELFPRDEPVLSNQITETSVGICSNIAQAFTHRSFTEKECFFEAAQGLLIRLENEFLIAQCLAYINQAQLDDMTRRISNTHWILVKLQKINQEWAKNRG